MAKRGSRKPERASTRPPARPKSSWPAHDTRAPKGRGKGGSPLATGNAKRGGGGGTSLSGKPTGDGDVGSIPSTEAPRKRKAVAEPKPVARKLTRSEVQEREQRLWKLFGKKRRLEREKKRVSADLSREITELSNELDQLHDEIESGHEQLRQGELPLEAAEIAAGAKTPTPGQANQALGEIAKRVGGGNGGAHDFDEADPEPEVDDALAGPTRIEAERPEAEA